MSKTVELNKDFELPAYRVGIEALLLLADAINQVFAAPKTVDILDRSEKGDWIELLLLLGKVNADPQTKVGETKRIADLWEIYFRQNDVKNLEAEVVEVFEQASKHSVQQSGAPDSIVDYLHVANESGHDIARRVLKKHATASLLPASPVPVEVFYDGPGQNYCAGSSLWTNQIRWAYQPVSHSLMGAILADLVFAHEYFSHLVPRNKHLSSTIREQWLVAALRQSLEEDKLVPYWKIRLWPRYRTALEAHVTALARIVQPDASAVRYSGFRGAEEILSVLSIRDAVTFWRLTKEILESKNDRELASNATDIAKTLANHGLPDLSAHKVLQIKDLAKLLGTAKLK